MFSVVSFSGGEGVFTGALNKVTMSGVQKLENACETIPLCDYYCDAVLGHLTVYSFPCAPFPCSQVPALFLR